MFEFFLIIEKIANKIVILGIDIGMLSLANHSIMTYGTFGMWGAILAGGKTVLPKSHAMNQPSLDMEFAKIPDWEWI